MIFSSLKNMKANSLLARQISIRFQRNIRYKHNINKIIPSSLKKRLAISNGIGKEINSILNKNIDGKNLTKCRLEVKGPYNKQMACSSTSNIVSIVEQMNHGHVSLRDGLPKQGFNLTTTASGTLFKTDEWKIQLRFRSYSEIVEIYDDHGIKNTIFKNQPGTNHKSWIEIKATKINIPYHLKSSIPGKLSIKRRMLVDNQLILKMLQSWESRFYMDWIKDQTSSIYNGFCDFSNILLEIKEKSADNPENTIDNALLAYGWNLFNQDGVGIYEECYKRGIKVHNAGVFSGIYHINAGSVAFSFEEQEKLRKINGWKELSLVCARSISWKNSRKIGRLTFPTLTKNSAVFE